MKEIVNSKAIVQDQEQLDLELKAALPDQGPHRLSHRGGGTSLRLYADGLRGLYYASNFIERDTTPRYWNAFGLYDGKSHRTQRIAVEINIPVPPSRRVAAFFAHDARTRAIFLMHDGKIGGGKKGVTRQAFLRYSELPLISTSSVPSDRQGVMVATLGDRNLVRDIESFVRHVVEFKDSVSEE